MGELADAEREEFERLTALDQQLAELKRISIERAMDFYKPYAKQHEFHRNGSNYRERLLMAGNQLGKTMAGSMETAFHLTGQYPDWWQGRRWEKPINSWAASNTTESTRNNPQRLLLGIDQSEWGSKAIPLSSIVGNPKKRPGAVDGAVERVTIRHASGGDSYLFFKSYDQGREKWQGPSIDHVWLDEEPPEDIYDEALTRTNATGGSVMLTFTPLLGMSKVVGRFYPMADSPDRVFTMMGIGDVDHLGPVEKQRILEQYPVWQRDVRLHGKPMLGEGAVFPVPESEVKCVPFDIPDHWPLIAGIDFGWEHPTAAAKLAWDRDNDRVFVVATYRKVKQTPLVHAGALKKWGEKLLFAWPHDGESSGRDGSKPFAVQYRSHGLNMLRAHATHEGAGGNSVEAGVSAMLERMQTDRLKVFSTCPDFFSEFNGYHRKNGKIVPRNDDILSATRYGLMMLRFARPPAIRRVGVGVETTQSGYDILRR